MTLFALPDDDTLYAALLARDPAWEGRALVGVASTGIFCRLTCPAPKPRRENCTFYETPADCARAGFRPCKRCHPLGEAPLVTELLEALQRDPARRWTEADLTDMGHDPSTVRRTFKRQLGQTFLDIARQRRLAQGMEALGAEDSVIAAQIDAGFSSPSAFRAAFARIMGRAPGSFPSQARLRAAPIQTELGPMVAVCDDSALYLLEFTDRKALPRELARLDADGRGLGIGRTAMHDRVEAQLTEFFAGARAAFDLALAPAGTPFHRSVWAELQRIPAGETRSYGDLARALGRPTATRAVAQANGANPIALVIPCHRVIGADGTLTGYGGGLWRKRRLIDLERRHHDRRTAADA